jgi:cell wall-associated NlpC family hydrolase
VQAGETVESIAARYTQGGYPVTASAIRAKNNGLEQPSVGYRLLIPLQSVSYRTQQPAVRQVSTSNPAGQSEVAREVVSAPPVYQAPSSRAAAPRLDGARVLGSGEEAAVTGSAVARPASAPASAPTAKVAVIAKTGARIRRLPEASAATLYQCAKGTELAVTQQRNGWSAILMSDRSTGWIPTHYLKFTGASVDISTQVLTNVRTARAHSYTPRGYVASRSGYAVRGTFSSDHPMVAEALKWLGTRYVYGGTTRNGIDCSALVQNSFRACGYRLPRTAAEQARVGTPIAVNDLQPGDRLYFSASGRRIDHTGLYMGNGLFVHASGTGRSVIVSNLFDRRNWNIYVGARR